MTDGIHKGDLHGRLSAEQSAIVKRLLERPSREPMTDTELDALLNRMTHHSTVTVKRIVGRRLVEQRIIRPGYHPSPLTDPSWRPASQRPSLTQRFLDWFRVPNKE